MSESSPPRPPSGLPPRERAEQALTFLAHETGSATVRLSGLTLADIHVDLETRLADAIADAEDAVTREWVDRYAKLEAEVARLSRALMDEKARNETRVDGVPADRSLGSTASEHEVK